jgi:uncharacterized membrane protein YgdD (TMEM256/DUF423 family)
MNNESMHKIFLILGTVLGGLAVALGAFGAHGLKKLVAPETIATYQTGVHYQMYHALALILLGILTERTANSFLNYSGLMFLGGVVFFSGSLYLIVSMQAMNKAIPTYIGIITPVGGLLFIIGWILLLLGIIRK